jgi:hypothetical protein
MHFAAKTPRESHADLIRHTFRNCMTLNAFTFLRGANAVEAIMPVHNGVLNLANIIVDRPIVAKRRINGIRRGIGGYCNK